jgi:RNA recognition motif-containing protein
VEYATREDAQTAIDTMSNTQLMGRLVYVREVRFKDSAWNDQRLTCIARTVRLSHALPVLLVEAAPVDLADVAAFKVALVASRAAWAAATVALPVVDVLKSTSPT